MPPTPRRHTKLTRHPAVPPPQTLPGPASAAHPASTPTSAPELAPAAETPIQRQEQRIEWTLEATALRAALVTWAAQHRKLERRTAQARTAATRVPAADIPAIVAKAAQDTATNPEHLTHALTHRSDNLRESEVEPTE